MANSNYCCSTPQIPSPTTTTSGQQQENYVSSFLHDHHYHCESFDHPFPGLVGAEMTELWSSRADECKAENGVEDHDANINNQVKTGRRKRRLSSEQADALERSFQEEIELEQQPGTTLDERKNKVKLEPERKMRLSRELELHPRQIAIWFQNRRAKLKRKKIEQLYNVLQQDFEIVARENQHLQEEVMKLKSKLDNRETMQASTRYEAQASPAEANGDKVATEITRLSAAIQSTDDIQGRTSDSNHISEYSTYLFDNENYYSTTSLPYWDVSQGYPKFQ
ncbi:homeobox-leucine zipper protein ATHB-22-like [Papaver somniferum]|uniref:homeobox-leucine zipper protein ATHB-22-like n=1 Tax=Papaver somniferum TaxID=3469 RepID=UPI000E6F8B70|nr:homeobox-leucine zipper protein ATHB-22-like [Papaver somniferum]